MERILLKLVGTRNPWNIAGASQPSLSLSFTPFFALDYFFFSSYFPLTCSYYGPFIITTPCSHSVLFFAHPRDFFRVRYETLSSVMNIYVSKNAVNKTISGRSDGKMNGNDWLSKILWFFAKINNHLFRGTDKIRLIFFYVKYRRL